MLMDKKAMFSDKQEITATAKSDNVYDFGKPDVLTPVPNIPTDAQITVQVVEDFNNCTSVTCEILTSNNKDLSSGVVRASAKLPLDDLKAGKSFPLFNLPGGLNRYVGLNYKVVGSNPTQGKITAGLVLDKTVNIGTGGV
ncbi:MAG: hypothetical protein K9M56_04275 [Victivallales bacterium]|nr:hypothetical protein [Victivallales bacterium]